MFTKKEINVIKKLNNPGKVQDFLNSLPFNFEKGGETLSSPFVTLRRGSAHCFEGALLGAYIMSRHGFEPQILYLKSTDDDYDHVVALFKINGFWGALSKTNHAVLRYREPIYKSVRELAMSYFHEYFLDDGRKTLRKYSEVFSLKNVPKDWVYEEKDLWYIDKMINKIKFYEIVPKSYIKKLRKAEKIEREAGKIVECKI